jgi:tetratricopeptide (TPR) repeat protein
VWLARNALGSYRAVKVVHRKSFDHDRPYEREFEGLKKFEPISHARESQVDIFHVGRNGEAGFFYYIMELADPVEMQNEKCKMKNAAAANPTASDRQQSILNYRPKTLRSLLRPNPQPSTPNPQPSAGLPVAECVQIALALTRALEHLHAHGLVHRDIKPSNIIFVKGVPKLADIGLVTSVDATRSFVGTDGYIPPEGPGTPQADLYSLGKVLYECVTGKDRLDFPELPADWRVRPDFDHLLDFNEILTKACDGDPRLRYQNAEAMQADLDRLHGGKSVRRAHRADHRWRLARRSAGWLAVVAMALTLIGLASRVWQPPANPEFSKRSTNSLANVQYDLGRNLYQKNTEADTAKAAEYFQAAVNADTNFVLAQAALAAAWSWSDVGTNRSWALLPRAQEIAERALANDDTLSEAHLAVAWHAFIKEWDWPKAEKHFRQAVKHDRQNPQPHEWYGLFLRSMGRTNDAIRELETAVNVNPRSQTGIQFLGRALLSARRYSEAVERLEMLVEMQTDSANLWFLGEALRWGGQIERSITVNARAAELNGLDPAKAAARTEALTRALHEGGEAAFWLKRFEFLSTETSDPLELAEACASVGRSEEALDLLERGYSEHHVSLVWDLKMHPKWDSLRGHPRFKSLLKKLKLE